MHIAVVKNKGGNGSIGLMVLKFIIRTKVIIIFEYYIKMQGGCCLGKNQ